MDKLPFALHAATEENEKIAFVASGDQIDLHWPLISSILEETPEAWKDRYDLKHIYAELCDNTLVALIAPKLPFVFLFCVVQYPKKRVLKITFCGGAPGRYRSTLFEYVQAYARIAEATEIEAITDPTIALWMNRSFGFVFERVYIVGPVQYKEH